MHPGTPQDVNQLPIISQKGQDFYAGGSPIQLRGVNLGGWFMEELWMTPWQGDPPSGSAETKVVDSTTLWALLEKRFGADGMNRIRNAYRQNWITDADFAAIARAGFNHVRIPFPGWILDEPGGLDWLKEAVKMAESHGLYVVLDMHGIRGGQSGDQPSGLVGKNRLWFDVQNIDDACHDWSVIAKTFAHDPGIAAYDLMNEPMGAPNTAMLFLVYDRFVRAVREAGDNHVVLIEDGYKGFKETPHPNLAGWTNCAFSLHFYDFGAKTADAHVKGLNDQAPDVRTLMGFRNAPMYVGEWNVEPNGGPTVAKPYAEGLNKNNFSWAFWTWKVFPKSGDLGDWGIVRPDAGNGKARVIFNPFTDTEDQLIAKMALVRTTPEMISKPMVSALGQAASAP